MGIAIYACNISQPSPSLRAAGFEPVFALLSLRSCAAMIQPPADFVESGCVVQSFKSITGKTLHQLPPFTPAHLVEFGLQLQQWFDSAFVGKSLTPNDAAAAANIGAYTAERIWSVMAQRSRFVKLSTFPNLVQPAPVAPAHPYFRVPPGIAVPWWSITMFDGMGSIKFKSRNYFPVVCINHAGSVLPTIGQLHLEHDDEMRALWDIARLKYTEYPRDNSVSAAVSFWMHQVATPLPANAGGGALTRNITNNTQKVFIDLSLPIDFSSACIAASFSWSGETVLAADPLLQAIALLDDSNAAKDAAIAAAAAAGSTIGGAAYTRANVYVPRTIAVDASRYNKTEFFCLILNEVSIDTTTSLVMSASGKRSRENDPLPKAKPMPKEPPTEPGHTKDD